MKLPIFTLLAVFLLRSALAQTLAPEIAPLAAKYDADVKTLDTAHAAAAATVQQKYLADLATAEKSASDRGKVDEVAAILKARQAVTAGDSSPQPIPNLSPSLQKRSADYLDALAVVDRDFAPRYQRISSDYLRNLANIEERLPATSPIREQIEGLKLNLAAASPKDKELLGVWLFIKSDWRGTRQVNPDGTFLDESGHPAGKWTATASEFRFNYTNGQIDRLKLPPRKGQLAGTANDGRALAATKQK